MKALNFQKNDGEQNLRREIRNMEEQSLVQAESLNLQYLKCRMIFELIASKKSTNY